MIQVLVLRGSHVCISRSAREKGVVKDVIQSNIQNPLVSRDTITLWLPSFISNCQRRQMPVLVCCLRISRLLFSANDINHLWRHFYALALTNEYKCSAWEGPCSYPFNPAPNVSSPFPRRLYFIFATMPAALFCLRLSI
jgi:hypothetical protein